MLVAMHKLSSSMDEDHLSPTDYYYSSIVNEQLMKQSCINETIMFEIIGL
jgi:hypothetical protein